MELQHIYNQIAQDFSITRKKIRPEFKIILNETSVFPKKQLHIADIWCGDGRLFGFLKENLENKQIYYTGLDFSSQLIKLAKKRFPSANWIEGDMLELHQYLSPLSQDIIVFLASFHHLKYFYQRLNVLKQAYQALNYGGKIILVNRNLRNRRYYKLLVWNVFKNFLLLRRNDLGWVKVPWKKEGKILQRYYHIFGITELERLLKLAGFEQITQFFVDPKGKITPKRRWTRNLVSIATKLF